MTGLTMSLEQWPVVLVVHDGAPSNEQVDAMIRATRMLIERGERYVVVFDSRKASVTQYMRTRCLEVMKTHFDDFKRDCGGLAYVFASPALRFILGGMLMFLPEPLPYKICATVAEATVWARDQLKIPA